jgi:hypothetical protein
VASGRFETKGMKTGARVDLLGSLLSPRFTTGAGWTMHRNICSDSKNDLSYVASSNYLIYLLTQVASPPPGRMHDMLKSETVWVR